MQFLARRSAPVWGCIDGGVFFCDKSAVLVQFLARRSALVWGFVGLISKKSLVAADSATVFFARIPIGISLFLRESPLVSADKSVAFARIPIGISRFKGSLESIATTKNLLFNRKKYIFSFLITLFFLAGRGPSRSLKSADTNGDSRKSNGFIG